MISILLTAVFVGLAYSACPGGWEHEGSFCYLISRDNASWPGSLTICESLGGTLAEVISQTVQTFLQKTLEESKYSGGNVFWIDGNDFAVENTWVDRGGNPLQYKNWGRSQPNNQFGSENCVAIRRDFGFNYTWTDDPCSDLNNYICQRSYTFTAGLVG